MKLSVQQLTKHTKQSSKVSAEKMAGQKNTASTFKFTVTVLGFSCLQVFAQSTPESSSGMQDGNEQEMELIEVFAQKRGQNNQDVPISITRFSSEFFEALEIKDATQLSAQAANVKITQNAGEGSPPSVNIRGIGLIDYNTSNTSPVAFYVDDVVTGSANNQIVNLFDIESIEILRSPQGTLFGRNTTGGAVLLQSKMPEQDVSGYVKAGYGDESHLHLEGAVNIPFSDNTLSRLAVAHHDYEYSTNNLDTSAPRRD